MRDTSVLRLPSPAFEAVDRPDLAALASFALRLAPPAAAPARPGEATADRLVVLRRPDLVADLRRARAARFADRYEWLALRRRRAQIAARHELGG
jgi:hypothetical protein